AVAAAAGDGDVALVADGGAVARGQRLAVDLDVAARDLHPGAASGRQGVRHASAVVEQRRVEPGILVHLDRAVVPVGRRDQPQVSALVGIDEGLLLVARPDAVAFRQQPDLQEVHRLALRVVELAVADAGAGRHALYVAGPDHRAGSD